MHRQSSNKEKASKVELEPLDRRQFEELYNEHFDALYLFAKKITQAEDLARDVVADVFLNLWNMGSVVSEIQEIRSYLFVSVKNLSLNALNQSKKQFSLNENMTSHGFADQITPEEVLIGKEVLKIIERAENDLPDQCKLVFEMVKKEHRTHEEVSQLLAISKNTVKNHMVKAVSIIRRHLEDYVNENPNFRDQLAHNAILVLFLAQLTSLV